MLKIVGHLIIRKCFCLLQEGKGGEPNIKLEGRRVTGRSGIWVKKGRDPSGVLYGYTKKTLPFRIG